MMNGGIERNMLITKVTIKKININLYFLKGGGGLLTFLTEDQYDLSLFFFNDSIVKKRCYNNQLI